MNMNILSPKKGALQVAPKHKMTFFFKMAPMIWIRYNNLIHHLNSESRDSSASIATV
jgi:hypothetical protein